MTRFQKLLIISAVAFITVMGGILGYLAFVKNNKDTTVPVAQAKPTYIALGDSVAAGIGLPTALDSSACNRTKEAYPSDLAIKSAFDVTNIACSGATLEAGILGPQTVNGLALSPQIDQLFSKPQPDFVTITIGANDLSWARWLGKCYTDSCGTADDQQQVDAQVAALQANLRTLFTKISEHYKEAKPKTYITGYHQVFPEQILTACLELTGIGQSELAWGRQLQNQLNSTIQTVAAEYPFVTFVPIDFSGHELCTVDTWVHGLRDPAPYHPNAAGQQAYAAAVANYTK